MGIKGLTQLIKTNSNSSIEHTKLFKISGKRVAVDASIFIYKSLIMYRYNNDFIKNSNGKITSHILGIFNKTVNYLSLNIELIFVFDGKAPDLKYECIKERKQKAQDAKDKMELCEDADKKNDLEKLLL